MIQNSIWRAILRPPAELYGGMMRARAELYRRGVLRAARLPGKTISVGNLTLGGSGKTPVTIWLAQQLQAAGYRPGILARGYGRRDENELIVLPPDRNKFAGQHEKGSGYAAADVGDEAILFRRHLPDVPIGLCADRARAANALAAECGVNLFLLDDGYQRLDVARDVNLLLVDASAAARSVGRDGLIPIGRLREPESAASRADLILLTRWEASSGPEVTLCKRLSRYTAAPVFRAETRLTGVYRASDEQMVPANEMRRDRWLAFCGIGNPAAFFGDLPRWGFEIVHSFAFRDHHRYSAEDLKLLAQAAKQAGATGLITTEKDFINLPRTLALGPALPLYYCRVALEPVELEFWQEILRRLEQAA